MSVLKDKFTLLVTEKTQREQVISGKDCFVRLYKGHKRELSKFQALKTSGTFDTVDAEIKTFLLQIETQYKNVLATLESSDEFMEIIGGGLPIE